MRSFVICTYLSILFGGSKKKKGGYNGEGTSHVLEEMKIHGLCGESMSESDNLEDMEVDRG